ncbi:MAG: type IV toxin-antitoxin system AbiEi family antitoxin domain-containing protein [Acidimicrobiales bacterium]
MRRDEDVARWASSSHGLVTRDIARQLGLTRSMIDWRLSTGRWVPVARGLYRIAGVPVTWEQRLLAACLLGGRGTVASHRSAAVLWGIGAIRPGAPEITMAPNRNGQRASRIGRVHRSGCLPAKDSTSRSHIPVTTPTRTVIDLASCLSRATLVEVVDDLVCRRLVILDDLAKRIAELDPARPGPGMLRGILEAWTPGPPPGSGPEMQVVRSLAQHGIAEPERQHEVLSGGRLVARMDLAWPAAMVGLELQSLRWHGPPQRFHADRGRILTLRSLGWDIIEVTPRLLESDGGALLCTAVTKALARASHGQPQGTAVGSLPCLQKT